MERLSWWHVIVFISIISILIYLAKKTHSQILVLIVGIIMICVAGLRHGYIDTRAYRVGFEKLVVSEYFTTKFLSDTSGFSFISAIIKIFTENSQIFLFILSLITVGCLYFGIVSRVPEIDIGVFLLITTGCYLDTMNGVRQYLVSAIMFLFLPRMIKERKLIIYIVFVLLLSTIHSSALVLLPMYFIASNKAWSRSTWQLIIGCIILFLFFNRGVNTFLADILKETEYGEDYSGMILLANTSVNIIRVFIASIPVIMSYIWKKDLMFDDIQYNIAFNMSVINLIIWIFATKVLYFYRLAFYFTPYMIVLLCYQLNMIRNSKFRRLIKTATVLCYFIYHIYSLYVMGDTFFIGYLKY